MTEGNSLIECFEKLNDPRVEGRCDHKLVDIIVIAVCASITGAGGWVEVETFGNSKEAWLRTFLELPFGIPSHDTFGRFFAALDAEEFQKQFARWVEGVFQVTEGQGVAVDGKTVRRSHAKGIGKVAIHMVSAWAKTNGIVLGQRKVDDKSNEITAIPELLRLLDVRGCLVTIDAMGCQTKIAQAIRDEHADYLLRVKENQGKLYQDIEEWFAYVDQNPPAQRHSTFAETFSKGHGRIEIRRCWALSDPLAFEYIRNYQGWTDLQTLVRVQRERRLADQIEVQTAYYISSAPNDAARLLEAARDHWAIENSLHWVLDVTFREDDSRARIGNSPQNMAVLRHLALNILKKHPSRGSIRQKRYQAALDHAFLLDLLQQI